MSTAFHCDICGKSTYLHPQSEPIFEEITTEVKLPYTVEIEDPNQPGVMIKTIEYRVETQTQKVPKITYFKRQNINTGDIENVPIQDIKDLQPRAYLVRLNLGQETIQKDFCKECLKDVLPDAQALWDKLAAIKSNLD